MRRAALSASLFVVHIPALIPHLIARDGRAESGYDGSMQYTPPPGYPAPPPPHDPNGAFSRGPSGAGVPALAVAAFGALALAVVAMGAERFAYYGTRASLYELTVRDGVPFASVYTAAAFFTALGVLVGGVLAFALGPRLAGVIGATLAAAGCLACVVFGVWGYALVALGSGVFRVAPVAVMLEAIPSTGARFRRVAAAAAAGYAVVDVVAFASSAFAMVRANLGVSWGFGLGAAPFGVAAVLCGALLWMGPRAHLQTDERLELTAGPAGDPYRGGPGSRVVGAAPLDPGLLAALMGAHLIVSIVSALPYYPRALPSGSLFRGLETLVSIAASAGLAAVLVTTPVRARSAHLFGVGLAVLAAGTVLRAVPLAPAGALAQLVLAFGHSLVAALGVAAFATRAPRRFGALAVALWALVPTWFGFALRALPSSSASESGASAGLAAAVAALGLVAAAVALGMLVFGERLQPGDDP